MSNFLVPILGLTLSLILGPIPGQFLAYFNLSKLVQPNTMDIGLLASSPSRVNFMLSLLLLTRGGVDP
jgi:hypothetical protein